MICQVGMYQSSWQTTRGETDIKLNKNQNKDSFVLTLPAISTTIKIHQKLMAVHVFLGYQKRQVSDLLAVTRAAQQERMLWKGSDAELKSYVVHNMYSCFMTHIYIFTCIYSMNTCEYSMNIYLFMCIYYNNIYIYIFRKFTATTFRYAEGGPDHKAPRR
jgi:HSP90 family molecular chaperone